MAVRPIITVWQPWATLIALGCKPHEFRRRAAPRMHVGRRVGIHAGSRKIVHGEVSDLIGRLRDAEMRWTTGLVNVDLAMELLTNSQVNPAELPLGSIVCTVVLGEPKPAGELVPDEVRDSDRLDHHQWGWPMLEVIPLRPLVPAKGKQGWWYAEVPEDS